MLLTLFVIRTQDTSYNAKAKKERKTLVMTKRTVIWLLVSFKSGSVYRA